MFEQADHGQLKRRLSPMRGFKADVNARVVIAAHAFVQNVRRGHYELAVDTPIPLRVAVAFVQLAAVADACSRWNLRSVCAGNR